MALHENEQQAYKALADEVSTMQKLAEELHERIVRGSRQGNIITFRPLQADDAPQKVRITSQG